MAGDVFQQAYAVVENVEHVVSDRIAEAAAAAAGARAAAETAISALGSINFDTNVGGVPEAPTLVNSPLTAIDIDPVVPTDFGSINGVSRELPSLEDIPSINGVVVPSFVPSVTSLNIPTPPSASAPINAPERGDYGSVTLPSAPSTALPSVPVLDELHIPTFEFPLIPEFTADSPEFAASALPALFEWSEPTYAVEILDEAMDEVRRMWAGGSGIPPQVEQAMYDRAAAREDMEVSRNVDAANEEFSARGFTMPTGYQTARIDAIRRDGQIKKLALNRDITIKIAEWQVENVRFGIQQAIAAENVFVGLFTNAAQRMFEAARFQVSAQIEVYNAQVALFNARQTAYRVAAEVFDIRIKAELAKIEVFKAQVEAEVAKGQLNEQRVSAYKAQVESVLAVVEIYKAQMQGASVQSDVIRSKIEAYKADVQAYAERINADKVRFDAYDSQVKGEASKAAIVESQARAYAALVQGKVAESEINVKRAELVIQKNRLDIEAFAAAVESDKVNMQTQLAVIQQAAAAYNANTQRFVAQAGAETAAANVLVTAHEAQQRTAVAFYQAKVAAYTSDMEQMIRKLALVVESLKSAGQLSATLAAGAMAGVNVGASLSGGGNVTAGGNISDTNSTTHNESRNENYNYEGT